MRLFLCKTEKVDKFATFAHSYMLEKVVIPEGVVEIRDGAFSSCGNLKKVTIPESLTDLHALRW